MSSPFSSDIPKPMGSTEKLAKDVNKAVAGPPPAFGDFGKAANDVRCCMLWWRKEGIGMARRKRG